MENPIKAIVGGIAYVIFYLNHLSKALLVPASMLVMLSLANLIPNLSVGGKFLIEALGIIPWTLIAITTHKIILESPQSVHQWGVNRIKYKLRA